MKFYDKRSMIICWSNNSMVYHKMTIKMDKWTHVNVIYMLLLFQLNFPFLLGAIIDLFVKSICIAGLIKHCNFHYENINSIMFNSIFINSSSTFSNYLFHRKTVNHTVWCFLCFIQTQLLKWSSSWAPMVSNFCRCSDVQ